MGFGDSKIRSYLPLSVVSFIFNPIFSIISIYFGLKVSKQVKEGNRKKAIFYSDLAFGFGYMAIVVTVIIVVMIYAYGGFPEHTYYCRQEVITGVKCEEDLPVAMMTTAATE